MTFEKGFLIGTASAGHQVEGNNTNSDIWALEHMQYGGYPERSGTAADFYHMYDEDFALLQKAGHNACRFSLEWARIEPEENVFDETETEHYRNVIRSCKAHGMVPMVTLFHFASPKWLISKGGWEAESTVEDFGNYVRYIAEHLGSEMDLVCTVNEANLGTLIAGYIRKMNEHAGGGTSLQIGMDLEEMQKQRAAQEAENLSVFGVRNAAVFPSPRSPHGTEIVLRAHQKAVEILHQVCPHIKAGLSLSLLDMQTVPGGEANREQEWNEQFRTFLPVIEHDDFLGLQNYTRGVYGPDGELKPAEGAELTEMGYEYYPEGLLNLLRTVSKEFHGDIYVTENGIATMDDDRRVSFIRTALSGVETALSEHIPVRGYFHWSMIDNYEWQSGYSMHFGVMSLDRETQKHTPKPSLYVLGEYSYKETG